MNGKESIGRFQRSPAARQRGFTIIELIVVVGIVAVLAALLFTALRGVKTSASMAESMNSMKQIATWMQTYANENRDAIVPSVFDYTANPVYAGKARSGELGYVVPGDFEEHQGTWTDILWVHSGVTVTGDESSGVTPYRYDSPDYLYLENNPDYHSPFWSAASNSFSAPSATGPDSLPRPFGPGGQDIGKPGFFAANNFFDSTDPAVGHLTMGQIRAPGRSVYLVDSAAGEVIEPEPDFWNIIPDGATDLREVDFRYNDTCLMLMLDGSVKSFGLSWDKLDDLEESGVRVRNLTSRE